MKFLKTTAVILMLSIFTTFLGCGNDKPSKVVENYFSDIQNDDSMFQEIIQELISTTNNQNTDMNEIPTETYEKIVNKIKEMKYTINNERINGNDATVNLTVEGIDLTSVVEDVIKDAFSEVFSRALSGEQMTEKETEEYIFNLFNKYIDEAENKERTGDITLSKVDGKWQINKDENFTKLLLGLDEEEIKNSLNSNSFGINN